MRMAHTAVASWGERKAQSLFSDIQRRGQARACSLYTQRRSQVKTQLFTNKEKLSESDPVTCEA